MLSNTSGSTGFAAALLMLLTGPAAVHAQTPRLEFDRTFGCLFCEGPEAFASIQSVTVGEDGTIVVTDAAPPMVRLFHPDGSISTLGPQGDGPGELRLPLTAIPRVDGGLIVVDLRQKRITYFEDGGEVEKVRPLNAFPAGAGYASGTGRLLLTTTDFRGGLALLEPGAAEGLDTVLARVPFLDSGGMRFVAPAVRDDGGFAFGEGEKLYRINVYGPDAQLERTLSRDLERRRRTPEELEAQRSRRMSSGEGRAAAEGGRPGEREIDPLQPHFYPLNALRFDDLDRLWVRTARALPGRTTFDVFAAAGDLLGSVIVDAEVGSYAVREGRLVAVVRDENDVQRIGVWRLR